MKKLSLRVIGIILLAALTIFVACTKDSEQLRKETEKLSFESFEKYGAIHNLVLTNFQENFEVDLAVENLDQGIESINSFNNNYVNDLDLTSSEKEMLHVALNDSKRFVYTQEFYEVLYSSSLNESKNEEEGFLFINIESALESDLIDQFEYVNLKSIGKKVKDNYNGNTSNEELECFLLQIKNEWVKQNYGKNSKYGRTLAITIAISLSSIDWWKNNPDAYLDDLNGTKVLPAWAAADIIGACYGAVVSGIGSYTTQGEVNWGAVGISAVGGAVAGSSGVIGKAAKWLSKL